MSTNLEIYQGTDYTRTATLYNAVNQVIDLTGYTLSAQIRKNPSSSSYVAFTCEITNYTQGKISLSLSNTQTAALAEGKYMYDVFITSVSKKYKICDGIINVIPRITR